VDRKQSPVAPRLAVAGVLALAAVLMRIGADSGWLAALGRYIAQHGVIPRGVPFASASTVHWPNVLVLAELILAGARGLLGDRGLMLLQLLCAGFGLTLLMRDARLRGAAPAGAAIAVALVGVAALPSIAIVRVQMFSLALFPLLAALLRAETRAPSRRIWLAVPLIALWGNLHGAVLVGLGVLGLYLLTDRLRRQPLVAVLVGLAAVAALYCCPVQIGTAQQYYEGVLGSVAAQRGIGMWGPISLSAPFDVATVLCAIVLTAVAIRARASWWELAATIALFAVTIGAARDGVWLLMFLAPMAAPGLRGARRLPAGASLVAGAFGALLLFAVLRGPVSYLPGQPLVTRAVALAHGTPIMASAAVDETVALAGGRVWAGEPIDAFTHRVQEGYVGWLQGKAVPVPADVVLVQRGTPAATRIAADREFSLIAADQHGLLYRRLGG
jgi:hypothetical protein